MRVSSNLAAGGTGRVGASAARVFLILLGVTAVAIGVSNIFVPTAEQAASVAAVSGAAFVDMLKAFDANPLLIRTHAIVGLSFVAAAALQFWPGLRRRHPAAHRRLGYFAFACVVGLPATGLACAIVYPFAGVAGIPPNVFWLTCIATCAWRSWRAIRAGDVPGHEIWITRATAMSMGAVSLFTLYEGALVHLLRMDPHTATAVGFWCGQGDGLLAAQIWLMRKGGPIARRNARKAVQA